MKHTLAFDFSVDKENKTITITREFAAARDLVWDAFTTREILDQWWAPKPWKVKTKSMDFRIGGHWRYAMCGPAGEEYWSWQTYTDVQPKTRYAGKDVFTDPEGNINTEWPQSMWEVTFTESEQGSVVTMLLSYDDLAQLEANIAMGFKEGITMTLDALTELLPSLKK